MIIFLSLFLELQNPHLQRANVVIWMLKYKYAYKSGQTIKTGGHDSQWGTISERGDILGHHVCGKLWLLADIRQMKKLGKLR